MKTQPLLLSLTALLGCDLALAAPKTSKPAFDPQAHTLLKKVFDRYRSLRSYSGTMRWTRSGTSLDAAQQRIRSGQTQVRVAQPKIYLSCRIDNSAFGQRYVDDGEDVYVNVLPNEVLRLSHTFVEQDELWKFSYASDFGIKALLQNRNPLQPYGSYVTSIVPGTDRKKGEAHVVVRLQAPTARGQIDYFLGRSDLSLHAVHVHQLVDGKTLDLSEEHSDIKFNPSLPPSQINPDAEMKRRAEEGRTKPQAPSAPNGELNGQR